MAIPSATCTTEFNLKRTGSVVWRAVILTALFLCVVSTALSHVGGIKRKITVGSNGGTVIILNDGTAWFAANGAPQGELGIRAYRGSQKVVAAVEAGEGVVTLFDGGGTYFSPDGTNLGGGGITVRAYAGRQSVVRIVAINGGVVTLFSGGAAYFSPDGRNLGGGGNTMRAYAGSQSIVELTEIPGALRTRFSGGGTYVSTTGVNLGGGGTTAATPAWHNFRASAEFGPRDSGNVLVKDGALLLSGGFFRSPGTSYSDLWRSRDDGVTWELLAGHVLPTDTAPPDHYDPYSPLRAGGRGLLAVGSQVWTSVDGSNWAPTAAGPIRATEDTYAFAFNGGYVMIQTYYGRVYTSPDGIVWDTGRPIPGFERRCGAAVAAALGRLWIQGGARCDYGGFFDDIWFSYDGVNWQRADHPGSGQAVSLAWPPRMWPAVCHDNETLWVIGGFQINGESRTNLDDIWYTRDGIDWRALTVKSSTGGAPAPRHAANCFVRSDSRRLLLLAGKGGADRNNDHAHVLNDVWSLELPGTLP